MAKAPSSQKLSKRNRGQRSNALGALKQGYEVFLFGGE